MAKNKFFPPVGSRGKPSAEPSSGVPEEEQRVVETMKETIERRLAPGSQISFQDIPLDRIRPNPFQAREEFTDNDIEELAESIRQHGFFGTLDLRPDPSEDGYFQLAYGERRWRAAQRVENFNALPCRIVAYSDTQMEDIGLLENLQRKALNPVEEAKGLARKMRQINPVSGAPYSIRSLAEYLGVKKNRVEETLRLVDMSLELQMMVRQRPDTIRSAFEIAKLPTSEARQPLIHLVLQKEASTRDIVYLVEQQLAFLAQQELISSGEKNAQSSDRKQESPLVSQTSPLAQEEAVEEKPETMKPHEIQSSSLILQEEEISAAPVSLDPSVFRLERQKKQDIRSMDMLLRRWSQWAESGDGDKVEMARHIATWLKELDELYKKLQ